ncbi:MAG: amine oxidase, partial [Friedmanniella sp.]|nr:amine oxidase [Friedmanniella sp.]
AGIAAAVGLAERGVRVLLVEPQPQLGGRVRAWPVTHGEDLVTMSRGFHAFFRQYYNLRALLRRVDPALDCLVPVEDYPLVLADGHADSFARIPRQPPLNMAAFVLQSPSFTLADLGRVDVPAALELLDVDFPQTFSDYDGESAAQFLDRLRFPEGARHLALEVFARSFFAHPTDFSAGELVGMFHTYFLGSSEGLLFDVPRDDYDTSLWAPLGRYLARLGVQVRTGEGVEWVDTTSPDGVPVGLTSGETVTASAVVVATDPASSRRLLLRTGIADPDWRDRVAAGRNSPPWAVLRLWLDRHVDAGRAPFLGTGNYGPLDNVTVLERFEEGARRWSQEHGGSVVELHAYALPGWPDEADLRARLRAELDRVYPELVGAGVRASEWLVADDCPLSSTAPWRRRLTVETPDARVVLAGDGIRCDYPVALMERAATTGWLAANRLLAGRGLAGHDLWTVPMRSRQPNVGRLRRAWAARTAS